MQILYEPVAVRHKKGSVCLTGSHDPGNAIGVNLRRPADISVKSKYPDRNIFPLDWPRAPAFGKKIEK